MTEEQSYDPFGQKKAERIAVRKMKKKDWKARMNQLSKVANFKSTNHVTKTL